jgi:predicted AlkP superfamily phosphohydrolase/phosphomutase
MVKKVLVIGLDSAPLSLLEPWIQAGELPILGRLMAQGATGVLRSTFPPLSPAAWSSFATGMYPGKHGVLDHSYRQSGTYKRVLTNARCRGGKTMWQLIGEGGGRVGVINVPETYPPEPVNGFLITGITTPSDDADWCYPSSLATELEKAVGGYRVYGSRSKESLDRSLAGMHETIPMRMRAAAYLWERYAPQFMILVFMETDWAQHKTWKYMDPSHPQYDPAGARKYGTAVLDVYRRVDEHLPLLLGQVDDETAVIVMSDHGAGPIDKWLYLNSWLLQEGFLRLKPNPPSRLRHLLFRLGWTPTTAYKLASKLQLGLVDRAADRAKRKASVMQAHPLMRLFLSFADVDWGQTRAYTLGGNLTGVWVNLRGREPEGCVSPGAEYEQVREELMDRLRALRDPDTGQPITTAIYRREELYEGPYLDRAPDVLFETLDEQYTGSGIQEFISNATMAPSPLFSGCHRRAGMVILKGVPFRQGARLGEHQIVDLAPTILYLLGYEVPTDLDGQVMVEALTTEYRKTHSIRISGKAWKLAKDDAEFSPEEEETVTERLRELGYL